MKGKTKLPSKSSDVDVCTKCGRSTVQEKSPDFYKKHLTDKAMQRIYAASFEIKGLGEEAALARSLIIKHIEDIDVWRDKVNELSQTAEAMENKSEKLEALRDLSRTVTKLDSMYSRLTSSLDLVGRLVEKDQKIREGLKLTVDIRTIILFLKQQSGIINSVCKECPKRDAIADEIERLNLIGSMIPKDVEFEEVE